MFENLKVIKKCETVFSFILNQIWSRSLESRGFRIFCPVSLCFKKEKEEDWVEIKLMVENFVDIEVG